jgi:hypothetical protein
LNVPREHVETIVVDEGEEFQGERPVSGSVLSSPTSGRELLTSLLNEPNNSPPWE